MRSIVFVAALAVTVLVPAVALYRVLRVRRAFSTAAEQATYNVLHKASEAAPPFRAGLTKAAAAKSIRGLHQLLGAPAVALTDETSLLAWDGVADHHGHQAALLGTGVIATGRAKVVTAADLSCKDPYCVIRSAVIVPIVVGDDVVGTLGAFGSDTRPGLERKPGQGHISMAAADAGPEARITVEDDGVGMDPQLVRSSLAGRNGGIGLANVDERLRTVFGADFGLTVETAPGAGTKVSLRIPKYRSGVRAS